MPDRTEDREGVPSSTAKLDDGVPTVVTGPGEAGAAAPETVGHYRILGPLGRGGMGVVFRAEDTRLGRVVALKFLPAEWTADAEKRERFVREARAASALDHPNVCTVHEIGETGSGDLYIAMACYEGETLRRRLGEGPLSPDEAVRIVSQLCSGLAKAHEKGIVHRDVKPENVIVTPDGIVKLLDFGLAKLASSASLTRSGSTAGTVAYMSPEQVEGTDVDARTDVWAVGVVLYESLAGRRPFEGDAPAAILRAIAEREPEPLGALRPDVSAELEGVVGRALAKDAGKRYESAAALLAALAAVPCAKSVTAGSPSERTTALPGAGLRRTSWRLRAVVLALLGLVAAAFAAYRLTRPVEPRDLSLAVLPLKNLNAEADEYFSDGMTDEIISRLSLVPGLRVVSRAAVMRYKDAPASVARAGAELGVTNLLEGSVRRSDGRVRLEVRLLEVRGQREIWKESFERDLDDVSEVLEDVPRQVARGLGLEAGSAPGPSSARLTADREAHDFYLRGREYFERRRKDDNEHAIGLFRKAVDRDPRFALALASLAEALAHRYAFDRSDPSCLEEAARTAERAIAVAPDLAEGHGALATAWTYAGKISKAVDENFRALERNPNDARAMSSLGQQLVVLGRLSEGLAWQKRATTLVPTDVVKEVFIGDTYFELGLDEEAARRFTKALQLRPDLVRPRAGLLQIALVAGRQDEAGRILDEMLKLAPEDGTTIWYAGFVNLLYGEDEAAGPFLERAGASPGLALVLRRTGRAREAESILDEAIAVNLEAVARGDEYYATPYTLAQLLAVKGDTAGALDWLERAVAAGFRRYRWMEIDPALRSLRGEERYGSLVARLRDDVNRMARLVRMAEGGTGGAPGGSLPRDGHDDEKPSGPRHP